ncbi:hypothetical protein ma142 [Moumouvirus australiensis]|uniref:Uncharacterized protein n=1 Tax=Moumouvirus australiensis TaxID=2109587 RepID=A0A2P1EKV4_9VIRU|nr:hypothetical protein QKC55_gp762 [Moumouvirus australiensis]AVL94528.1 hypothetical protein ma142 [Moumouvirus australiensis]
MYYFNIQPKINVHLDLIIINAREHFIKNEITFLRIQPRSLNNIITFILFSIKFDGQVVHFKIYKNGLIQVISKTLDNYSELLLSIIQILNLGSIGKLYTVRCTKRFYDSKNKFETKQIDLSPIYYNISDITD